MKKPKQTARTWLLGTMAVSMLLSGCNKLTQYTISEREVNTYLQKHSDFKKNIGIPGVADARIQVTDLASQIGRTEADKVRLSGNARVDIDTLWGSQQADVQLTLQAQPYYDKSRGAIYLRDMRLLDYRVQPETLASTFSALSPYLDLALKSYFDTQPAYVLDADRDKNEALAKRLAQRIDVIPGALVIPFSY